MLYKLYCLFLTDVESKSSPIELRLGHDDDEDEVVDSDDEGKHILIKSHINFLTLKRLGRGHQCGPLF